MPTFNVPDSFGAEIQEKKPPVGTGERFKQLAAKTSPRLAAYLGRKKYGKKGMSKLSARGRRRAKKSS